MCKKHWNLVANYHTMEIFLKEDHLLIKDWFDPGKNPNIHEVTFDEFLNGKFNFEIMMEYDGWVVKEIKENILKVRQEEK